MAKAHAYYNEYDKNAAAWLRELIKLKLIADGEVDERSIIDVQANDIRGFSQCHFFAGIGGWSYALRLAGIPDDYPCWTASLPCQPFSSAGKQLGKDDERHLLPHYLELVRQCKPNIQFGEQVEGAIRHGWLDDLQANMEAEGYAIGHCVLGAHSVGAFHQRQRLYWVAKNKLGDTESQRNLREPCSIHSEITGQVGTHLHEFISASEVFSGMGHTICESIRGEVGFVGSEECTDSRKSKISRKQWEISGNDGSVKWIGCKDGKYRAVEPSIKPLVNGVSERMVRSGDSSIEIDYNNTQEARAMRLKGYGNAICVPVAALFISAALEISQ